MEPTNPSNRTQTPQTTGAGQLEPQPAEAGKLESGQSNFSNRSVKKVDNPPLMAGRFLGLHLQKASLKDKIQILRHASLSTIWHLLSNKMEKLQHSRPARFMEEASQLCTTPKDWSLLFKKGDQLKAQHPRLSDQIEGWQKVAWGHMAGNVNYTTTESQIEHLGKMANKAASLETSLPVQDRHSQPGAGFRKLAASIKELLPYMEQPNLGFTHSYLKTLNSSFPQEERSPVTPLLDRCQERIKQLASEAATQPPTDATDNQQESVPQKLFHQETLNQIDNYKYDRVRVNRHAMDTIEQMPDSALQELAATLKESPEDDRVWKEFDELKSEIPATELKSLLIDVYNAAPDSRTAQRKLIYNVLPLTPDDPNLWTVFQSVAEHTNPQSLIDCLEPLHRQDPGNTDVKAGMLYLLMKMQQEGWDRSTTSDQEAKRYQKLHDDLLNNKL